MIERVPGTKYYTIKSTINDEFMCTGPCDTRQKRRHVLTQLAPTPAEEDPDTWRERSMWVIKKDPSFYKIKNMEDEYMYAGGQKLDKK